MARPPENNVAGLQDVFEQKIDLSQKVAMIHILWDETVKLRMELAKAKALIARLQLKKTALEEERDQIMAESVSTFSRCLVQLAKAKRDRSEKLKALETVETLELAHQEDAKEIARLRALVERMR